MLRIGSKLRKFQKLSRFAFSNSEVAEAGQKLKDHSNKVMIYRNGELVERSALVLKNKAKIEDYVFNVLRSNYRTTFKNGLEMESRLKDHGLDSVDCIEIAMQIEEELGYKIPSENLAIFSKVKHFVNFIQQVEFFKETYKREPSA